MLIWCFQEIFSFKYIPKNFVTNSLLTGTLSMCNGGNSLLTGTLSMCNGGNSLLTGTLSMCNGGKVFEDYWSDHVKVGEELHKW